MKKKPNTRSPMTMFPVILGVTLAFLIVATVGGIFLVTTLLNKANNDASLTVNIPNLVGEVYNDQLIDAMKERNISFSVSYVNNDLYDKDIISYQEPKAGQTRKVRSKEDTVEVAIQISLGKSSFVLEDLSGKDYRMTKIELERRGVIVIPEEQYDRNIAQGLVITTKPEPGATVHNGDTVILVVSKGAEIAYSNMIDVRGKEAGEAKRMLYNANFVVGNITKAYSDTVPEGCVISQSVAPGTSTPQKQTPVNLVISMGPKNPQPPVTQPGSTETP